MIEIQNVSKWYGDFQVLTDCSTSIKKGEVVVICGPSGSGKSTLIKTINALEPFQAGEIRVDGVALHDPKTNLPKLRSRVGMVFQHFELFPHLTVTENLTLAQIKVLQRNQEDAKNRGLKILERVGLSAHKDKFPGQLSGGQQQRLCIARALARRARVDPILFKVQVNIAERGRMGLHRRRQQQHAQGHQHKGQQALQTKNRCGKKFHG